MQNTIEKVKKMHLNNNGFILQETLNGAFAELIYHLEVYSNFNVSIQKKEKVIELK